MVFSSRGPSVPMEVAAHIEHPSGRLKPGDIDTDRPGRSFDRAGYGRHGMAQEEDAHERDEHKFALELAEYLDKNRMAGVFDLLVIVAGPKLLGKLRAALSEPTRKLVKAELDKDLIDPTEADLRKHLEGLARV
jgi:protein required for attachment to host cells